MFHIQSLLLSLVAPNSLELEVLAQMAAIPSNIIKTLTQSHSAIDVVIISKL